MECEQCPSHLCSIGEQQLEERSKCDWILDVRSIFKLLYLPNGSYHGTAGRIPIENIDQVSQFYDVFSRAVKEVIGAEENIDYNGYV